MIEIGEQEILERGPNRWQILLPQIQGGYELERSAGGDYRAKGMFDPKARFKFAFVAGSSEWTFEALNGEEKPWPGELNYRRQESMSEVDFDGIVAIIREQMEEFYQRIAWMFHPLGKVPINPKRPSRRRKVPD